ncbi:MAG: 1-acyl-sn-glycerol-3-phosphate acyltransferase [Cyclobacteriaceae bacterium]|nr:1-acyl-sn-glycerol-3-phosphate acyltransferase [Cyclobacteriaceae bacterium]
MQDKYNNKTKYKPILSSHSEWPIVKLSKNMPAFIKKVSVNSFEKIKSIKNEEQKLIEELERTRYREKLRVQKMPWSVDPDDDFDFWNKVKKQLASSSGKPNETAKPADEILKSITNRYANEIASTFKPSSHRFARRVTTFGFARLLNAAHSGRFSGLFKARHTLRDKIRIRGSVDHLRDLAKKGTIIMVPTHFSNLDSVLIGWVIQALGLPPFIYGAGLNLFNIKLFAYFMNSLGAYKVDRRKKNLIYLETLKSYSDLAIQEGCHSLFFPGGTRSRSGAIETELKRGLLGTSIQAQLANFKNNKDHKIFVVPVVLNYNFVLEAPSLIEHFLKQKGQERYYTENDEYSTSYKISKFLFKFFTKQSDISVSIGKPMDLFGNYVDSDGHSIGQNGHYIATKDYFLRDGKFVDDPQRDEEYTRNLSKRIVEEFHRNNEVLPSHLVAYIGFELLRKKFPDLDLFNFLRLPEDELLLDYGEFTREVEKLVKIIKIIEEEGGILTSPALDKPATEIIEHGLDNLGIFHTNLPLVRNEQGDIETESLSLLYFYHNRLRGYNFEEHGG